MPYDPLHHKYRPQTFAELVGQEAIATTLTNALLTQRIAPAYLFTGPRGTGKTSSARILAKSLNCQSVEQPTPTPCGKCEVCRMITRGSALDVIEIDAASNTGVDNIREIIERSQFAPVQCRYKVYVIDECHMLSTAAFNALLKTLEEPPPRVVFVLATTDPQRVLPTIISRCQRFDYRRIPLESMVKHLHTIAQKENIDIEYEAISLVAQIANGGLRDAESLLDQLSLSSETVNVDKVWDLVGAVPEQDLMKLLKAIKDDDSTLVIDQCRHLMNRGREPLVVLQNLASFYLNLLIAKTAPNRQDMVAVTNPTWKELCQEAKRWDLPLILLGQQHLKENEYQLKNTTQPRLWLEITLLGLLPSAQKPVTNVNNTEVNPASKPVTETPKPSAVISEAKPVTETPKLSGVISEEKPVIETPKPPAVNSVTPVNNPSETVVNTPKIEPQQPEPISVEKTTEPITNISQDQLWQKVINNLQPPTTQSLLEQHCTLISFKDNVATIGVKSEPLLKIAQGKKANIEAAFKKVCNQTIAILLVVGSAQIKGENKTNNLSNNYQVSQPNGRETIEKKSPMIQPKSVENSVKNATVNFNTKPSSNGQIKPKPEPHPPKPKEVTPLEEVKPVTPQGNNSVLNFSQIAENIAKVFNGEIVDLDSRFPLEITENLESKSDPVVQENLEEDELEF